MSRKWEYVSEEFFSNCWIEAFKAKIKDPFHVKVYFCKPLIKNGKFQMFHFMWSDGVNDFDFTDYDTVTDNSIFCQKVHLFFPGMIRKLPLGFAKDYSRKRNRGPWRINT